MEVTNGGEDPSLVEYQEIDKWLEITSPEVQDCPETNVSGL